jgi:Uncharacterised nucleotidyltransferase
MNRDEQSVLLNSIASVGLAARDQRTRAIAADYWPALRSRILGHRLTGLALHACELGVLKLPEENHTELRGLHRDAMALALRLEASLIEVAEALGRAGVDVTILKGPAVAHGYYPDPGWRPFSDLDLLVGEGHWTAATETLTRMGFERELPEPRAGFDVNFGKAVTWRSGPIGIDLHRTLAAGPFGLWMKPDELRARREEFTLGGEIFERFDATGLLLHACVHASLGWRPPLLLPLRDVLQIASAGTIDWTRVRAWSERWRLNAVLQHSFTTASGVLGASLPGPAQSFLELPVATKELRALEAYTTDRRRRGGTALATIQAIPGLRRRARYARSLLLPERAFLRARANDGESASYVRRWMTPANWLLGRKNES